MDERTASLVVDLVEKVGLLRRDMQQKGDADRYEARWSRVDQKLSALAQAVSPIDTATGLLNADGSVKKMTTFIDDWHAVHPAAPVAAPR